MGSTPSPSRQVVQNVRQQASEDLSHPAGAHTAAGLLNANSKRLQDEKAILAETAWAYGMMLLSVLCLLKLTVAHSAIQSPPLASMA